MLNGPNAMEKTFSAMSNLHTNPCLKLDTEK